MSGLPYEELKRCLQERYDASLHHKYSNARFIVLYDEELPAVLKALTEAQQAQQLREQLSATQIQLQRHAQAYRELNDYGHAQAEEIASLQSQLAEREKVLQEAQKAADINFQEWRKLRAQLAEQEKEVLARHELYERDFRQLRTALEKAEAVISIYGDRYSWASNARGYDEWVRGATGNAEAKQYLASREKENRAGGE